MGQNVDIATTYLDELTTALKSDIDSGEGFDNKSVMWLIKAWTKIAILTNGPGVHKKASAYYIMKREPTQLGANSKRSKELLMYLNAYLSLLEHNGTTGGDYYTRADRAMLDFVWEYRKAITGQKEDSGKGEADFVRQIQQWMALSEDQVMKQVVFNMDRSA